MDKEIRSCIQRVTQDTRTLLEREYAEQLDGVFDIRLDGTMATEPGAHLDAAQRVVRDKLVAAVEHRCAGGCLRAEAVAAYRCEAAFTTLNQFVALKMLEARGLVQECLSRGEQSSGFKEFTGLAPGLVQLPDHGYQIYIESLFDEIGREVRVLFDRRDPGSLLWPRRQALLDLLGLLNAPDLASVWSEDETIGWVYQFFSSGEERRQMREESPAPRNSHELAVRNQFFTPRYVVQFLTENTLGRMWLAMQGEDTRLPAHCAYLVRNGAEGRLQPKKDPRDLKVLDPACGSGHFLLYAFDLLLAIYEEAWHDPHAAPHTTTGHTLHQDYPDLNVLRRAMPALIIEDNLYGVDIDPRAAQIAALALWMRAQRAWQDGGVRANERPPVTRTHIVVAEPMPGDADLVEAFAAQLYPPLLGGLFKKMVGEMRLAGELGTLLRVEEAIASELRHARQQFVQQQQMTGYLPGLEPERRQSELDFSGIDDDHFFHEAEARIIEALRQFAESAAGSAGVRRRLFAGDAAQGIALIDLERTRFDVVLMNPPFGACSLPAKQVFEQSYPRTKNDLYAAFVERGVQLLVPRGHLGAITSRTGFFLSSFKKWREEILLKEAPPVVFADLGYGVLDSAMVEVAAYCLGGEPMTTVFLRAIEVEDKATALREAIRNPAAARRHSRFEVDPKSFASVPGSPFAYWVSERLRRLFTELPPFEAEGRVARQGGVNGDDFRWLRLWTEVKLPIGQDRYVPIAKGGKFSPFYADLPLTARWDVVRGTFWAFTGLPHRPSLKPASFDFYFRPGLTWPVRAVGFSPSPVPRGCIFSARGYLATSERDNLLYMLGIMGSKPFEALFRISLSGVRPEFIVGVIAGVPFPNATELQENEIMSHARRAWSLKRSLDTRTEPSHAFTLPALLQVEGLILADRAAAWVERICATAAELAAIQADIDARCFDLYGIDEADRRAITAGFGTSGEDAAAAEPDAPAEDDSEDDEDTPTTATDVASLAAELVSWTVGVAFGRFDVRLATGTRALPPEPEPFDVLPVCSPAMLTGDDGLPLAVAPVGYPLTFPADGVLVDDPGHARDLTTAVRTVFEVVFDNHADVLRHEAAALLDPQDSDLRAWLAKSFFEHHLKRYSKSRRKAPILWQLATPLGQYAIWLYAHRLTRDSLFQVLNDFIGLKLAHEERRFTALTQEVGQNPTASQRKEIAEQDAFIAELRTMRDEVARIAPLWNPDLNDGVVLTMAPLWRLVPQHRVWQKELKTAWDALCAGKYDWAHVAMQLWPERVVPKCAEDRSLAIAHGLENVFWIEGPDGKWQARKVDRAMVDTLITARTSPAVKEALHNLLNAPAPTGGRGRGARQATRHASWQRSGVTPAVTRANGDSTAGTPEIDPALLDAVKQAIASAAGGASKPEILAATGLTDSQWNAAINGLLAQGVVTKTGERRGTRYHHAEMGGPS